MATDPPEDAPGTGGGLSTLPDEVWQVLERSVTVEYTSLTRGGAPIMVPVTPYVGDDRATLDVSTGLTYPTKAERARRNPKVCLLYSDPLGSGLVRSPVVLVQGLGTVRDADLQANTDRYIRLAMTKTPAAFQKQPKMLLRTLNWYFARIWIQVTPLHVWWWDSETLSATPERWHAPPRTAAPASDPAPPGKQPAAWLEPPSDWRTTAQDVISRLDQRSLAWTGADGFPLSVPVLDMDQTNDGFHLRVGQQKPGRPSGPACLTLHTHPEEFTGQENHTFVGQVRDGTNGELTFVVDRVLADWSLTGNRIVRSLGFLRKGRQLKPRLASEAARRGQPVPTVHVP